ncbi:hypothetical protein BC941DRAFT_465182 [Chlamydoabsidia padenii]|nr:hypothetical protein BC941DRAFT_465182 [Chlamydoabsidia padenii]
MDQLVEQENEARTQMDALVADYQDILQKQQLAHDRKLKELKIELELSDDKAQQRYSKLMVRYKKLQSDYDTLLHQHRNQRDQLTQTTQSTNNQQGPSQSERLETILVKTEKKHMDQLNERHCDKKQIQLGKHLHMSDLDTMGQQHRNELQLLYGEYQQSLEIKNQQLEAYAYRLQSITLAHEKALTSCRMKSSHRIDHLLRQIEGFKTTTQGYINTLETIQTHMITLEQRHEHDQHAILQLTQQNQTLLDQLSHLAPTT